VTTRKDTASGSSRGLMMSFVFLYWMLMESGTVLTIFCHLGDVLEISLRYFKNGIVNPPILSYVAGSSAKMSEKSNGKRFYHLKRVHLEFKIFS
jgi:hypothetical protein